MSKVPKKVIFLISVLNISFFIAFGILYRLDFYQLFGPEIFVVENSMVRDNIAKILFIAYILMTILTVIFLVAFVKDKVLGFQVHKVMFLGFLICGMLFFGLLEFGFVGLPIILAAMLWFPILLAHRFYALKEFKGLEVSKIFE